MISFIKWSYCQSMREMGKKLSSMSGTLTRLAETLCPELNEKGGSIPYDGTNEENLSAPERDISHLVHIEQDLLIPASFIFFLLAQRITDCLILFFLSARLGDWKNSHVDLCNCPTPHSWNLSNPFLWRWQGTTNSKASIRPRRIDSLSRILRHCDVHEPVPGPGKGKMYHYDMNPDLRAM